MLEEVALFMEIRRRVSLFSAGFSSLALLAAEAGWKELLLRYFLSPPLWLPSIRL